MSDRSQLVLAADVGATTTRLGIFGKALGPRFPIAANTVSTADFQSTEELFGEFLADTGRQASVATLAVAGPVRDGVVTTDTLPWRVDGNALRSNLGVASLRLMNDLEAVATAVPLLQPDDVETLRPGTSHDGGVVAVIGLGTGLGEAFLVHTAEGRVACASEGGHTAFAPSTQTELGLLRELQARFGYVSYEMVCSGMALPELYRFVRSESASPGPDPVFDDLGAGMDATRLIVDRALSGEDGSEACRAALDLLVGILGAEAGNLALTVNATAGLYLCGGMPSRILPLLRSGQFLERLESKGRDSAFLHAIPVHVITNTFAGLMGAAMNGLEALAVETSAAGAQGAE